MAWLLACHSLAGWSQQTNSVPTVAATNAPLAASTGLFAEAQWRQGLCRGSYPTMEVYLNNRTSQRVEWNRALINGVEVKHMTNGVLWCQFYPSETSETGGNAVLLQINLDRVPNDTQRVTVETKDGQSVQAEFHQFNYRRAEITGATFSMDFRKMYVTYQLDDPDDSHDRSLQQVLLNGRELISGSQVFDERQETSFGRQGLIVIRPPSSFSQGDMLHLRLQFANGMVAQNMFRAWKGMFLDDFGIGFAEKDLKLRKELGLDLELSVRPMPDDPACEDVHAQQPGRSTRAILDERIKWYREGDKRLSFPYLCTATSGNIHYNIYAQISDALQVNPYCLGWQAAPRFPETEEMKLRWGVEAARPRPCYWIPEAFCFSKRMLEAPELRVEMYAVLGVGIKGIRYYTYAEPGATNMTTYSQSPTLLAEIKKLNREVKTLEPYLSPAIPMAQEFYDSTGTIVPDFDSRGYEAKDPQYRVYTLWSGDEGALILIRESGYTTDRELNALGLKPRFKYTPKRNITVRVRKPCWLNATTELRVQDLLTKETFPTQLVQDRMVQDRIQFTLPELDLTRALWIPNTRLQSTP